MGVNCKGLNKVIHFGPPSSLEDYFQETGRIGRDGTESHALLLLFPGCMRSKNIKKDVKDYTKNTELCRRSMLLKIFGALENSIAPLHQCCDVCQSSCDCGSCPPIHKFQNIQLMEEVLNANEIVNLSEFGKTVLKQKLLALREEYKENAAGGNISMEFPLRSINEIIEIANSAISLEKIDSETSIIDETLYEKTLELVKTCIDCYPSEGVFSDIEENLSSAMESSNESSESEDEYKKCSLGNSTDSEED